MRLGVILPSFRADPGAALACAAYAEGRVDGVFAYDHLFPMGAPERPALAPFPLLAAVAARHEGLMVGPLVARVGMVPDATLLAQLRSLAGLSAAGLVAGLGVGDAKGEPERIAYGLPAVPLGERLASLEAITAELLGAGSAVWLGGAGPSVAKVAQRTGAAVNLWASDAEAVASRAQLGEVTWAAVSSRWATPGAMHEELSALALAGASWAVVGWPGEAGEAEQRDTLDALKGWAAR